MGRSRPKLPPQIFRSYLCAGRAQPHTDISAPSGVLAYKMQRPIRHRISHACHTALYSLPTLHLHSPRTVPLCKGCTAATAIRFQTCPEPCPPPLARHQPASPPLCSPSSPSLSLLLSRIAAAGPPAAPLRACHRHRRRLCREAALRRLQIPPSLILYPWGTLYCTFPVKHPRLHLLAFPAEAASPSAPPAAARSRDRIFVAAVLEYSTVLYSTVQAARPDQPSMRAVSQTLRNPPYGGLAQPPAIGAICPILLFWPRFRLQYPLSNSPIVVHSIRSSFPDRVTHLPFSLLFPVLLHRLPSRLL